MPARARARRSGMLRDPDQGGSRCPPAGPTRGSHSLAHLPLPQASASALVLCSLPSLYQQECHCLPRPSSLGPYRTPTSTPSQCKGLEGRKEGSSKWPDPEGVQRDIQGGFHPDIIRTLKDGFQESQVFTQNIGKHTLKLTYICTYAPCTPTPPSYRPAHSTPACTPPHSNTHTHISHVTTLKHILTYTHARVHVQSPPHKASHVWSLAQVHTHIHEHTHILTPIHKHTDVSTIYLH